MREERKPVYEDCYNTRNTNLYPILNIACQSGKQKILIKSLADTGCDSGFVLLDVELEILKRTYKEFDIGEKRNSEPMKITVADGHQVAADVYFAWVELAGEKKVVEVLVLHPSQILGTETSEIEKIEDIFPCVGRNFLNHFDVVFHGKSQKIAVFKC